MDVPQRGAEVVRHRIAECLELLIDVGQLRGVCRVAFALNLVLLQRMLEPLHFGQVARRRKHTLQAPVAVVKRGRVVGDVRERAVPRARGQFVVGDLAFRQHAPDARFGAARIREAVLERRADQLVARASGQGLRLPVDVGDDAPRVGRHQRVDAGFDQRARVELLIAQPLVEPLPLFLDLVPGGVVRADEQVADDRRVRVAKGRDRERCRQPTAVFANLGQLIDILDPARRLEHQRLESRRNRHPELGTQGMGTLNQFLPVVQGGG